MYISSGPSYSLERTGILVGRRQQGARTFPPELEDCGSIPSCVLGVPMLLVGHI